MSERRHSASAALAVALLLAAGCSDELWSRPEQRAQRDFDAERFAEAAEEYTDPERRGVALFRAGEFEEAASVLGRTASAEGAFNRGNALVMLGEYTEAMKAYERALQLRPGWREAEENHELARLRHLLKNPEVEDVGGTVGDDGGKMVPLAVPHVGVSDNVAVLHVRPQTAFDAAAAR